MAFACPFCQFQGPPVSEMKVSAMGWVVFIVLILFCLPLCWIPFVVDGCKEEVRRCTSCGSRLG